MNLAQVARILAGFVLFFTLGQVPPLVLALLGEPAPPGVDATVGFGAGIALGLLAALLLWLAGRSERQGFFRREGLAAVGFAWCLAGALGSLPFLWSGAYGTSADALFESISGLTTCGASVCGAPQNHAIEDLPRSILLWRAMLQWLGGIGIVLVFVVLLPAMGVTSKNLLLSEQIGVSQETFLPRMRQQARSLLRLYVLLTLAEAALLMLAGLSAFDALCHALTTMATGGFSTRNASIGAYDSVAVEIIVIVFMFLAGTNFALLLAVARNPWRAPAPLWRNPEFRVYALLTTALIGISTVVLWAWGRTVPDAAIGTTHTYGDLSRCLRDAAFQVVSILSCTGYSSADFQLWPRPILVLLLLCMLVGASTGSTAGGLKILRLCVVWELMAYALRRFIRPKSVEKLKVGNDVVPDGLVSAIVALVLLWLTCLAIGTFLVSLDPRLDLLGAFSANATAMACCGPAITGVVEVADGGFALALPAGVDVGPYGSFGSLAGWTKLLLCLQMVLGRLEILAPLALVVPAFWRR